MSRITPDYGISTINPEEPQKKHRKRLGDKVLTGTELVPIYLRVGVEFDDVVDTVVDQLRAIAHRIAGVTSD